MLLSEVCTPQRLFPDEFRKVLLLNCSRGAGRAPPLLRQLQTLHSPLELCFSSPLWKTSSLSLKAFFSKLFFKISFFFPPLLSPSLVLLSSRCVIFFFFYVEALPVHTSCTSCGGVFAVPLDCRTTVSSCVAHTHSWPSDV